MQFLSIKAMFRSFGVLSIALVLLVCASERAQATDSTPAANVDAAHNAAKKHNAAVHGTSDSAAENPQGMCEGAPGSCDASILDEAIKGKYIPDSGSQ